MSTFWCKNRVDVVRDFGASDEGAARSRITTLLPSSCRMMAVCNPMPLAPPVIKHVELVPLFS